MINLKKYLLVVNFLFFVNIYGQKNSKIYTQTGILFFSSSYTNLLESLVYSDAINFIYVPDIFFPIKKKTNSIERDFNTNNIFEGIGITNITQRRKKLLNSKKYINKQYTDCYSDTTYNLVYADIKYTFVDNSNYSLDCEEPISINNGKNIVKFSFKRKQIRIIAIKLI